MTTTATARYAHEVAPHPNGHDFWDPNHTTDTIVGDLARHHIARCYGFQDAASDATNPRLAEASANYLNEYRLASIWFRLACTDAHDPEQIAVDLVTDLTSPQVFASNVAELLEWAEIDPASIRPYMSKGA